MSDNKPNNPHQIQLQIDDKVAEGIYVNSANVMFNKGEFVIDFIRVTPPPGKPKVMSRVIMSPIQMKAFLKALENNVEKYENQHGKIILDEKDKKVGFDR
ncbi:conserved hypothetical protein [Thermotomaculum hydrothermale]|uniref:DUF3467 domain-containing protein n=1 Tax=Thermotomaculum hydrothermale TaxID=981385 RepID=A0A7R6SYC8_9BACT|nr:DUF3467 domain-containing protein [Thermotomaculum hydrothermale]BBB32500.1 conserved hypothetical protein [Thermotomaculum hydrothermale]